MLWAHPTEEATWQAIVRAAFDEVPGTEMAGITVLRGNRFQTLAPSEDRVRKVDAVQYELRSGPCVDAIVDHTVFRTGSLGEDERWPAFGQRVAAEFGVHSMIGIRLYLEGNPTIGALNLYASARDAFAEDAVVSAQILATHAAIALSGVRRLSDAEHLRIALASNREIAVAIGVLMSRYALAEQEAFDLLRMASQHSHRKLRDVAADVARTGTLDLPPVTRPEPTNSPRNGVPAA
jgi:GAF domain-containing protein